MTYLLIVPTGLYIALAMSILRRRPFGFAYLMLALFASNAALMTAAHLVLRTSQESIVQILAARIETMSVSWGAMVMVPLLLFSLYYGERFKSYRLQVFSVTLGIAPFLAILLVAALRYALGTTTLPTYRAWLLTEQRTWAASMFIWGVLVLPGVVVSSIAWRRHRALGQDVLTLAGGMGLGVAVLLLLPHFSSALETFVLFLGPALLVITLLALLLRRMTAIPTHITAETLSVLASLLTTHSLHDALLTLLAQLREILPYDRASVLLETEPGILGVYAFEGFLNVPEQSQEEWRKTSISVADYPYLQRIFQEDRPQLVRDTATDPLWKSDGRPYGSWIGIPLSFRGKVLGCLSIVHHRPHFFTEAHMYLAAAFADQAVVAVENVRLLEAEQRRRRHAEFLLRASYALASSSDLPSALRTSLESLSQVLDFHRAYIGLVDMERGVWLSPIGFPPLGGEYAFKSLALDNCPLLYEALAQRRAILLHDTREEPRWVTADDIPETRSWIGVPLVAQGRVIGALGVHNLQPGGFSQEEFQLVRVFANQIAAVLDNFRLLEESSRQNQALTTLNTILAASNEALSARDDVLHVSLLRVLESLELKGGVIHQYIPAERHLRLRVSEGLSPQVVEALASVPVENPEALGLSPLALPEGEEMTFLSVPLLSHGATIGLLSVLAPPDEAALASLHEGLKGIGQQLGVVMDNAILFEATTSRAALSADLSRVGLAISAQLERKAVLDLLCKESAAALGVQGAYIWLLENHHLVGEAAHGPAAERFLGHLISLEDRHLLPVQVLREWRPRYINYAAGTKALPDFFTTEVHTQAALAVPLLKADVLLGTLLLVNTERPDAFEEWVLEQVGVLGVQAALTLQNAALFQEVRHRLEQLRLVNELSRYTTVLLNLPHLLEGIAQMLSSRLNYDLIALLNATPQQLVVHAVFCQGEVLEPTVLDQPFVQLAQQARKSAAPAQDNIPYTLPLEKGASETNGESILCSLAIPLIIADEVTGVLIVARKKAYSITADDVDALKPLAAQIAISISNARLYEKVRQQTVVLEERVIQRTAEIRHQQERTEAILRSVADAVIVFDLKGQVMLTNPAARAIFDAHDLEMDLGRRVR